MSRRVAKILEIGPYPPPLAGWSIRIRYVREYLNSIGHDCQALNIGKNRNIPDPEYITVRNGFDYAWKTFYYAARGYTMHMHSNGDGVVGLTLSLISAIAGFLLGRRIVVTFHAGTIQQNFPRERSGKLFFPFYLLFKLPKTIICNNEAVKAKIVEYGISPDKIVPLEAFSTTYLDAQEVPLPDHVEEFIPKCDPLIYTYFFIRDGFDLDAVVVALRKLIDRYPSIGIVNAGAIEDFEAPVKERISAKIEELGIGDNLCFAGDLEHAQFLSLARRSKIYMRSHMRDGECSSVFEALTLGKPVVAVENGQRPDSVVTYAEGNGDELAERLIDVLENYEEHCSKVEKPPVRDTVSVEADILVEAALGKAAAEALRSEATASDDDSSTPSETETPAPTASSNS